MIAAKIRSFFSEKNLLGLVLFLALLLRLPLLNGSFWLDEGAQALESLRPLSQQLNIAADFQPPLFHFLVHFLSYFSQEEWWLRQASLLPGLGSILFTMLIARRWFGKEAALVSGIFLATSSLHIFFSQELRPYMLAVFWAIASLWVLDVFAQPRRKGKKTNEPKDMLLKSCILGSFVALGIYSSYVMVFWWPAVFLAAAVFARQRVPFIFFSGCVALILFAPWALTGLREQLAVSAALRESVPGWEGVVSLTSDRALPMVFAKFVSGVERVDFSLSYFVGLGLPYILLGLGFLKVFYATLQKSLKKTDFFTQHEKVFFLGALFLFSLSLAWIFSLITPVIAPKRVMYLLPILALLLGEVVRKTRYFGLIIFLAFLSWNIWSIGRYWSDPSLQRENWRQVVQDITYNFPAEKSALIMAHDAPFSPWYWYDKTPYQVVSTGMKPLDSAQEAREHLLPILDKETILVFDYLRDLSDPYRVIDTALMDAGYKEKAVFDYPEIGFVRVFMQDRLYAQAYNEGGI